MGIAISGENRCKRSANGFRAAKAEAPFRRSCRQPFSFARVYVSRVFQKQVKGEWFCDFLIATRLRYVRGARTNFEWV